MVVIEMNPRVSRSSALASKATGFPIAKVAAKLAVGYTLDEILNDVTKVTPASFEPTLDYVVVKIPRFTFEKFPGTEPLLTTAMKSVGESMAMGRNFAESLQKALRSLETGLTGLNEMAFATADEARAALSRPTPDRLLVAAQGLRMGVSVEEIHAIAKYDPWFIRQLQDIVAVEATIKAGEWQKPEQLAHIKRMGFSDKRIAELAGTNAETVSALRAQHNLHPVFKRVDTCAAEFDSATPYMYSTYEGIGAECESEPTDKEKIIILGGGPNRIGQGIEFDYCCVHAAYALKEAGFETIMVNCNPETVSTDYDTSDRLYFEPLTAEDVLEIIRKEQTNGKLKGVIVQFGGQTPLKLARALEKAGVPIIGTSPDSIDLAEDRDRFRKLVDELGLKQPKSGIGRTTAQIMHEAKHIGFPLLVRPSYVLGGRAMAIMYDEPSLSKYVDELTKMFGDGPILIDSYLQDAVELDVDALSDGQEVFVAGIMQHIEEAGIHSGDSACSLPPYSLDPSLLLSVREQTTKLAHALKVIGLMNIQFAIKDGEIYLIEVNPRASRTVPFVAKSI
ncbi:MAG: carbamoyl-phosphate synthase large subunit, partial [Rickettsiales bacterium]|nr:carbamoyl-phosphate synthase large subunit [Rickettsiales bacterium]